MNSSTLDSNLFKRAFTSMWKDWKLKIKNYENLNTWWDMGKAKIRDIATWCSIKLKQDKMKRIEELEALLRESDVDRNVPM